MAAHAAMNPTVTDITFLPTSSKQISRKRAGLMLGLRFLAWPIRLAGGLRFAGFDVGDDFWIGGQNFAGHGDQFRFVDLGDAECRDGVGDGFAFEHDGENFAGAAGVEIAGLGRAGSNRPVPSARTGNFSIGVSCSFSTRSTSCATQLAAVLPSFVRVGEFDEVFDERPALVDDHVAVVGGDAVGRFQPRAQLRRAVRRATLAPLRLLLGVTVTGTRSGSGK